MRNVRVVCGKGLFFSWTRYSTTFQRKKQWIRKDVPSAASWWNTRIGVYDVSCLTRINAPNTVRVSEPLLPLWKVIHTSRYLDNLWARNETLMSHRIWRFELAGRRPTSKLNPMRFSFRTQRFLRYWGVQIYSLSDHTYNLSEHDSAALTFEPFPSPEDTEVARVGLGVIQYTIR